MVHDFLRYITDDLCNLLPVYGFQGRGLEYVKQHDHVVSCIGVQTHSSEPRCCVNLGVHLDFLPILGGTGPVKLESMNVTYCEIRRRLTPSPSLDDFWWSYGEGGARQGLLAVLEEHGLPFFAKYESFPDYWLSISLEDLRAGAFATRLPGMTRVRAVLLLARVNAFVGNRARCQEIATYGLEIVPSVATGPKRAFKELLEQ